MDIETIDYYLVDRSPDPWFVPLAFSPYTVNVSPRFWFVPQPQTQLIPKHPDVFFVEVNLGEQG